jgi:mono/diheme cytochrome c family protein
MKSNTSLLIAGVSAAALYLGAALAQDAKPGADEWIAPARAAKKKNPIEANEASLAKGKVVWAKECASCHGDKGKGDGPAVKDLEKKPEDLTLPKTLSQTDGALFWKITEGRKPMASYAQTLSEEDRWHVINYMRTLAPKPAK